MSFAPASFQHRGGSGDGYHLITPENRAYSVLPELRSVRVTKLVTPRRAPARFAQYLLELEPGGGGAVPSLASGEHFVYGLAGEATVAIGGGTHSLAPGRFAYLPPGAALELDNPRDEEPAQVLWFKRRYEPLADREPPPPRAGDREGIAEAEFSPGLYRTELLGGDPRLDFTIVRMRFLPGAEIGMVELHEEEHGLYMTAGRGLYLLGSTLYPVETDDFIYMAPYCPQSFVADAEVGGEYLLYKDAFRDGF